MRTGSAILSLVNLLLLAALLLVLRHRRDGVAPALGLGSHGDGVLTPIDSESALAQRSVERPSEFDWQLAAATDLHPFVAALREVECPAATLEDIIVAEVNRRFAGRERALKLRPSDYAFWDPPAPGEASLRYRKAELAALFEEKRALLSELLGSEVALEMPAILAEAPGSRNGAAYLSVPEAKRAAVRAIHERYRAAVGRIRAESFGSLSEDDVQKLDTLRKEQRSALAGLLTTDELTDFDLGTSNLAGWLKSQFRGAALTQEELRSVFRRFQGSIDAASLAVLGEGLDLGKASAELLATGGPAEELFGEARTAELRRARDPIYRMYQAAFVRAGIPDEVLNQVYEVQRAAIQDSNRRIYDSATSVQERQRLMEESQETARKSLRDVVGEEAFQRLVEGGTLPFLRVGRSKSTPP